MVKCLDWPIAVCTWSLGNDLEKIKTLADETSFTQLHLAVSPALGEDGASYLDRVEKTGLQISATMIDFPHEDYTSIDAIRVTGGIVPDEHWQNDRKAVFAATELTKKLGVPYLTFHMGFIDPEDEQNMQKLIDRMKAIADKAAENNIMVLLETGQETAEELSTFLERLNHPAVGINFDPANIILYDNGSPIDALKTLVPHVKHVHIKDAKRTKTLGTWGEEVPWSTGEVNSSEFLNTLKQTGFSGTLAVEREAGDDRFGDIKFAVEQLRDFAS